MSHLFHDIRGEGFARRARVQQALVWLLAVGRPLGGESAALAEAGGRCLTAPLTLTPGTAAAQPLARRNGVALRAAHTLGATSARPVRLPEQDARPLQTGEPLPPGFDAVAPYGAVRLHDGVVEALAPVAPGENIQLTDTPPVVTLAAGRPLTPPLLALLAAAGQSAVMAHRRPRVRIVAVGAARSGPPDQVTAALAAAVVRDGGVVTDIARPAPALPDIAAVYAAPGCDLVLSVGRTGSGADDIAPPALALAGDIAFHGLALRPGGSTAVGQAADHPVILLPGQPMSALVAYAMLAAPLLGRLGGCDPLPPPTELRDSFVQRRLPSEPGMLDVFPVRIDEDGVAHCLGDPWRLGPAALAADGVVMVGEDSDGLPAGAGVVVYSLNGTLLDATAPDF